MSDIRLSVRKDFSETPGGRHISEGEFSAEAFMASCLRPRFLQAQEEGKTLLVSLDGTYGYSTGFLEEAFGGLAREFGGERVLATLQFISYEEPFLVEEILEYIKDVELHAAGTG